MKILAFLFFLACALIFVPPLMVYAWLTVLVWLVRVF